MSDPRPFWDRLYFALCILLIGFGAISILSIGAPFILLGTALALRRPLRHRPTLFIAILIGTLVFLGTTILIAPLSCTRSLIGSTSSHTVESFTRCDNLLGFTYEGETGYGPALWPAPLVGMGAGVTSSLLYVRARKGWTYRATTTRGGK